MSSCEHIGWHPPPPSLAPDLDLHTAAELADRLEQEALGETPNKDGLRVLQHHLADQRVVLEVRRFDEVFVELAKVLLVEILHKRTVGRRGKTGVVPTGRCLLLLSGRADVYNHRNSPSPYAHP